MGDKSRKLESLKHEGKEQVRRAEKMKEDAMRHKKEVDGLEEAATLLKQGQTELESAEGADAIRGLERAKNAAKMEIDRIRTDRERLLGENKKLTESVKRAQQISRSVGQRLEQIRNSAQGEVAREITTVTKSLGNEWNGLIEADLTLSTARLKLQQIRIE